MSIDPHEKNRICWNQMTDLHVDHPGYKTREVIEGGSSLYKLEQEALGDVKGKSLLHLMCHFGLDTLSWARKGAIVTGADISDRAIKVANELKVKTGLEAEFIRSDLFDLPDNLNRKFDIAYQSYGTLCWLSDVNRWADVVSHFLKPNGIFYFVDTHPATFSFLEVDDYFNDKPIVLENDNDYCEREIIVKGEKHQYQYTISQIINSLINAGLVIERLDEYPFCYAMIGDDVLKNDDGFWHPQHNPNRFPYMLAVKARKY